MADSNVELTKQELKSFRSQLFEIGLDEDNSRDKLQNIFDEYENKTIEPFVEEFLIAGFDVEILNEKSKTLAKPFTSTELPSLRKGDATYWDRDRLLFCLVFDNIDIFSKGLKLIIAKKPNEIDNFNVEVKDVNHSNSDIGSEDSISDDVETLETWRNVSLVKVAVLRDIQSAIEQLGALNSNINYTAVRQVYEFGHWERLRKLLEKRKRMKWKPVRLCKFISFLIRAQTYDKDFKDDVDGKVDFGKCVDILFKYAEYDINELNDEQYSALHLAVAYNKTKLIFDLLEKGAYIGLLDTMDRPPIWNINPTTLEKYFDRCIVGDDLIVFNFENLISPSDDHPNDMEAIEFISNSYDLKHLLEHPLIASFLFLKWNRLALVFYSDCLCYFILSLIIGCISIYYIQNPAHHLIKMCIFTFLFIIYVTIRRMVQLIFCSVNYRKSVESYLNTLLTILIVVFLLFFVTAVALDFHSPTLAAICIMLITYEFFTLAGTFWHFSIYSEMFIAVLKSSIKSLQLYAIFLPSFSLLFYILLGDRNAKDATETNLNKFPSLSSSIVKTIVMSAGEFDVINVNFDVNFISIYVFIGFLFLISTVFWNLLNGLAVSDTTKIQLKAELTSFRRRSLVLSRYEEVLYNKNHWFRARYRSMWKICKYFTHLNTFVYQDKRIYIELDDKQKVYSVKVMPSNVVCLRVPLRSWTRIQTAKMSSKIVDRALQIREKHEMIQHIGDEKNDNERDELVDRIVKIETTLKTIDYTLKAISRKLLISGTKLKRKNRKNKKSRGKAIDTNAE